MFSYHLPWYPCNFCTISPKNEVRRIFYSSMGSASKSHTDTVSQNSQLPVIVTPQVKQKIYVKLKTLY